MNKYIFLLAIVVVLGYTYLTEYFIDADDKTTTIEKWKKILNKVKSHPTFLKPFNTKKKNPNIVSLVVCVGAAYLSLLHLSIYFCFYSLYLLLAINWAWFKVIRVTIKETLF